MVIYMNSFESCWHCDRYLILANYLLAEKTNHCELSGSNHAPVFGNPFKLGFGAPIPAVILTSLVAVINIVKLPFELLAKLVLKGASFCGSKKASEWNKNIDLGLTLRKITFAAIECLSHAIALVFFLGLGAGLVSAWVSSKLTEIQGEWETANYIQLLEESKSGERKTIELNYDDIVKASRKIMPPQLPPVLCAFGFASSAIKQFADNYSYAMKEFHTQENGEIQCYTRTYTGLYYDLGESLCKCGTGGRMKQAIEKQDHSFNFRRYKWVLEPMKRQLAPRTRGFFC